MGQACSGQGATGEETIFVAQEAGFAMRIRTQKRMGWKKDMPDFRDRVLALPSHKKTGLRPKVDLRPEENFTIYDQGHLGSCTANAIGAAFHFDQVRQGLRDFVPSRLFIYYNERSMEGTVDQDSGAYIRDGIKSVNKLGVCPEALWPYSEGKFTAKPPTDCYTAALKNVCKEYARVPQTLEDMKACINEGFPFVFGFVVFSSFQTEEVAKTGIMVMPQEGDSMIGGHAVQACGYDDERQVFIVRNSWGEGWGDKGHFYMPYDYITKDGLAHDMWAIRFVDGVEFPCTKA